MRPRNLVINLSSDEIMWDDPDLIYQDPYALHTFNIPFLALPENDSS